ncbi:MFS transporter [Frigoribacterium sp. 2-23]|uniref:MFS transporter n=1 Tax=Frigoribacterium sp. 2-23 TaxID=3415006 RepID=UPI003C6FBDB2
MTDSTPASAGIDPAGRPAEEARPRSRPAASRVLWSLLAAHAISQTGNVVTTFAVPFYVLATGGSGLQIGVAAFFATAPVIIGGPLGGVVVDRIGHRRAAITADVVSGVTVLAIPVLALTTGLPFWALLALVFVGGLLDTPGQTARRVMLPGFSTAAGVTLERSVGFLDGSERFARLVGAPLAGLLVAAAGPLNALFVDAASFAVSALITLLLVPRPAARSVASGATASDPATATDAPSPTRASYWSDLAEGFRFVSRDPLMRAIVLLVLVTNLFDAARSSSLMPLYAADRLGGAAALGALVAVMGGGALVGSILFGFVAHRMPRRLTFSICFMLAGGPSLAAFAVGLPLPWLIAATALSGLAAGALNPILGAVELERVPEHMRARVFGLINAGAWAGIPFGALLGGLAADTIGLTISFAVLAIAYVVVTAVPLRGGTWRLMEKAAISRRVASR